MFNKTINFFTHSDVKLRQTRWIFASMLIGAILSLVAAFVLSVESIEIAKNPDAALSCNVNAVINCATVAKHPTANLLGFPNSFIGLMAEPVVITVAIAGLLGVAFPRRFMFVAQIFYTAGFIFALYLFFTSVFVIQALCPWCLLVTVSTTLVFASMLHYNIREDNLYLSRKVSRSLQKWIQKGYDKFFTALILTAMLFMVLFKYSDGLFG